VLLKSVSPKILVPALMLVVLCSCSAQSGAQEDGASREDKTPLETTENAHPFGERAEESTGSTTPEPAGGKT